MDKFKRSPAAVIVKDGKYLVMKHTKHQELSFCIGKCEDNETQIQGLCRETFEELGINIISSKLATKYMRTYYGTGEPVEFETCVYDVTNYDGTIFNKEPHKCGGLLWMTQDEILTAIERGEAVADCIVEYFNNKKGQLS